MKCYEAVARLHLYIGRELNDEEVAIVQQHLADCPSCECRFHLDMRIQRLVHERCTIERAPAHLREAVLRIARMPMNETFPLDPEVEMEIKADVEEAGESF
jgi:mycothiol system anti-sigma-R factor